MADTERGRRLGLAEKVLIGLGLGVLTGLFFGELVAWLKVVGDIFIKLLQISVIPYMSLALITGIGSQRLEDVGRLARKGGVVMLTIWLITLTAIVLVPLAFPNWPSASFFSVSLLEERPGPDFLRLFIPSNPFFAYANAVVPAVVVFSILLGITLIGVRERGALIEPLNVVLKSVARIASMVSSLAPLGVFALMASAVGTTDLQDLARLQVFIVLHTLLVLVLAFWILPAMIMAVTTIRYGELMRALRTSLITAFATGSSLVVLPLLIEQCKQLLEESTTTADGGKEDEPSPVDVLIPTFYPFPSAATLLVLTFVLFAGWYIGSSIPVASYSTLIFAGVPSLFGGSVLAVPFLLSVLNLPDDLFNVFVSVDVINSRFGTLLAAMHYATIALIGAVALNSKLRVKWAALVRSGVVGVVLLGAVFLSVNAFYSHVLVVPYTKAEALKNLRFMGKMQPATVLDESDAAARVPERPATFEEILDRGVMRVCFQPNEYPSSFTKDTSPPELVGFDIEMAHRLASRRQLSLEFIPARSELLAAERLDAGVCDIYMRSLSVSAGRAQMFGLTVPVYRSSAAIIVPERREVYRTWEAMNALGPELRLGYHGSREDLGLLQDLLPEAVKTPLEDMAQQDRVLQDGAPDLDGILDQSEEAAAWTLLHPSYSVVVPKPTVYLPVSYAVARENRDLLEALDAWILAEQAKGTVDRMYDHWMLGGAVKQDRPPRWSIIRDVLGWVD